jgi:predicted anti-sigma-YlaC factor YlaD
MSEMTCDAVDALSAELALGIADARESAAALSHVEHCPVCRSRLRDLADLAEDLLAVIPAAEPPSGFESRVLASVRREPDAPSTHDWRRPALRAAAAVVLVALIGTGAWMLGRTSAQRPASSATAPASGVLRADHHPVGQVVVVGGSDPWISVKVDAPLARMVVRCQVRRADGQVHTVGTFMVEPGYSYWGASVPPGSPVVSAQLVSVQGKVLATAVLRAAA